MQKTHLTNFDSLRVLVEKFNDSLPSGELCHALDPSIVQVRDAIAHGRVLDSTNSPVHDGVFRGRLFKFSKPKGNFVDLEFDQALSVAWYESTLQRTRDQHKHIVDCASKRGYRCFSG